MRRLSRLWEQLEQMHQSKAQIDGGLRGPQCCLSRKLSGGRGYRRLGFSVAFKPLSGLLPVFSDYFLFLPSLFMVW